MPKCIYINGRAVTPHHILTVKDALVKSVCYVTKQIIFIRILQFSVEYMDKSTTKQENNNNNNLMQRSPSWDASQAIPRIFWKRRFIIAFTPSRELSLSWAKSTLSTPPSHYLEDPS